MENRVMQITQNWLKAKESGLKTLPHKYDSLRQISPYLQCAMFAVINYKTLILLGVTIIPQNINGTSSLVSRCCLVDSHLINSLPFFSLSSSSGGNFGFSLPSWAGRTGAWLCLCRVLCCATSPSQLSQTLHSFSSGFSLPFSLLLPDAPSFWAWLEDIQSDLHPTAVIWSQFCSFLPPPPPGFDLVPEFHYLIHLFW